MILPFLICLFPMWPKEYRVLDHMLEAAEGGEDWFELKLEDHKKAIFQAQQSCAYAECSIIVIPPEKVNKYDQYQITMDRWGIGLASFDLKNHLFKLVRKPRKSKAFSPEHRVYAIKQLFSDHAETE